MEEVNGPIGVIGLGQMGGAIAARLLEAGHQVIGYRRGDASGFAAAGGIVAGSAGEVAARCNVLLLCLPCEASQHEVLQGEGQLIQAMRPGQVVIECGTYPHGMKQAQAALLAQRGVEMLEIEISGSPGMVTSGDAALYLGGDPALARRCAGLLDAITAKRFHIGGMGAAVTMKVLANILVSVHTAAAAEVVNLGVQAGLSAERVAEVVGQGAGGSAMFAMRAPMMARRAFLPAPGSLDTLSKYLDMADALSRERGTQMPVFDAAAALFRAATARDGGREDIAAVIKVLESNNLKEGVELAY